VTRARSPASRATNSGPRAKRDGAMRRGDWRVRGVPASHKSQGPEGPSSSPSGSETTRRLVGAHHDNGRLQRLVRGTCPVDAAPARGLPARGGSQEPATRGSGTWDDRPRGFAFESERSGSRTGCHRPSRSVRSARDGRSLEQAQANSIEPMEGALEARDESSTRSHRKPPR